MDIYDSLYFRLNKKQLRIIGLWPYDSRRKVVQIFWMVFIFVLNMPNITGMIANASNVDRLMLHVVVSCMICGISFKHFTLVIAENKMKSVYDDIAENWLMITDEDEKKILVEYSNGGRIFTVAYTGMVSFCGVVMISLPLVPEILNAIDPLSLPRGHLYVTYGEYLLDNHDDHFYEIYLWESSTVLCLAIICAPIDSMYSVSVQHCLALCAIIASRLSKLPARMLSDSQDATDSSYEWLVHTVKLHETVLSFAKNINNSYSLCFFCLTLLNMAGLPVLCVIMIVHLHSAMHFFRAGIVFATLMVHLFVLFWPGQKLIDHSGRLADDACHNDWYETSHRTKKILWIFMIRCSKPCSITAGGLMEMNFENYFKVVKRSASYITVLASFQ